LSRKNKINKSYFFIEVTYDGETAKIFRGIYLDKIRLCDLELLNVEDQMEANRILKDKEFLQRQLKVFNKRNPY
jgi:hypothetical protein